jgi:hypothetical protein
MLRGMLAGGGAVAIGLPALDIMLDDSGTAYADGVEIPTRFGVWFWGNGVRRQHWIPSGEGADWVAGEELLPLEGVRPWMHVLTGFAIKTATHPHHSGMAGILTGAPHKKLGDVRDTIVSTFAQPSVDQVAATHFDGTTPYRSLEVAVSRFRGTDEGTTFQYLSHNGPENVNPSEESPQKFFQRLFGAGPAEPQLLAARASVLDLVGTQVKSLQGQLGARDKIRLEQHLDSIKTLEDRLKGPLAECNTPDDPGELGDVEGNEPIEEKNRAMSDLMALALACGLTRSFSIMFSTCGSGVIMWPVGAVNGLHQLNHDQAPPAPTVHAATVFTMQQLAYFLERLRDTPEGAGNLLDSCSILCTTELSEGWTHSNDEFPILIAGKGGGRLKGGIHYRSPNQENTSKALLTALRGGGVPLAEFGSEGGHVTEGVSAIEV